MPNEFVIKQFRNLESGDVIYAKRYRSKKEKNKIDEGHKVGPYLIIKMGYDKLYCLYGTSVTPSKNSKKTYYKSNKKNIKQKNNTYVNSYFCLDYIDVIDLNRFLGKRYHLDNYEFNKIYKIIKQNKNINIIDRPSLNENKKKKKKKSTKKPIEIEMLYEVQNGDIILKNNNYYLITKKENKKLKCLPLKGDDDNLKKGIISNQLSNLEYINFVEIEEDNSIEYINYIENNLLNYIMKKREEYSNKKSIAQRGSVLLFDNQLYYIYYREGNKFYCYELYENKNNSSINIYINDISFYIGFENIKVIDFKDNYVIKHLATEKDMTEIKNEREKYLRKKEHNKEISNVVKEKIINKNKLIEGCLVKLNIDNDYYVIISYYENCVACIKEQDLLNNNKNVIYISVGNIKYILKEVTEKRIENNKKLLKKLFSNDYELEGILMENKKRYEFNSVEPFDIIWARRDIEENEILGNEKGYEGSYIVVGRDVDKLYCIRGEHKLKDYYNDYIVFSRLTKNKYGEEKIIYYINIDIKVIDYDKFINRKSRLNVEEKRDLVCGIKQQKNINDRECYDIDLSIKSGDIIKKDKLYLVIYRYNDDLHCIEIDDDRDLKNSFYINDIKKINYNEVKLFNIDDDLTFVNKISTELYRKTLRKYKEENYELINYMNKERNTNIGLILEFNDNLYYLYDILGIDDLICYKIIPNNEEYDVFINGNKFKIDLDNIIHIEMKNNFKPICYPYYEERNEIDNLIKERNKSKKLLK